MSLIVENIHYSVRGEPYLTDINLTFNSGQFNVILGRTLAGKTSLLRIIAGLDAPQQGKVTLDGRDITRLPVQQRRLSMVYQQFINYPHLSVWENIASPLKIARVKASEISRRVSHIAELLQISALLDKYPLSLSGGQQQRCAMARALVKDAQIILFDEPLVNLDYKLRESLRHELKALFKARDSVAIYTTTEATEALALGGSTTLLHQGSVLQTGPALQQFYSPHNLTAADLYHEPPMNRIAGRIDAGRLSFAKALDLADIPHLSQLAEGDYCFALRPDQVYLKSQSSLDIAMQAWVDLSEISASETYLHVTIDDQEFKGQQWIARLTGIYPLAPKSSVRLYFSPASLLAFSPAGQICCNPSSSQVSHRGAG